MNNPLTGLLAGVLAALFGAAVWATVTVVTEYQIGFMAVGVGALCGWLVGLTGGSNELLKGAMGAGTALGGCVLGNLLSGIGFVAQAEGMGYFEMLQIFNWGASGDLLGVMFQPIDLLFYGIAIFEGYKLAARPTTLAE